MQSSSGYEDSDEFYCSLQDSNELLESSKKVRQVINTLT